MSTAVADFAETAVGKAEIIEILEGMKLYSYDSKDNEKFADT